MSLPKKSSSIIDPEVNKYPSSVYSNGNRRLLAHVHAVVNFRLQSNHAVLILFLLSTILSVVTATLYWKVRALDVKNQAMKATLQSFICKWEKEMYEMMDENFTDLCSELKLRPGGDEKTVGVGRDRDYGEQRRTKRDLGSKVDTGVDATLVVNSSESGGKYYGMRGRNGRGMRGKVFKTGQKLKALKRRVAAVERNLLNVNGSISQRLEYSEPRAAFLYMNGGLKLTTENELIGPWTLDSNGSSIGFSDQWLKNLRMDPDKCTVTILESGMYFIYAQVYYNYDTSKTRPDDRLPLGYRITLKKNPELAPKKPTINLAECVTPPLLLDSYLTCFTQVAWYVDAGDKLYLESIYFTHNARSKIESDNQAQTFLGLVKL